jgi:uncharacterized membrane protein
MINLLFAAVVAAAFLSIGFACVFWPERVWQFYLDASNDSPFLFFMKSRIYLWYLRFIGLIAILACTAVLILLSQAELPQPTP